ncbi:hypothetical protein [Paracoccus sp. AK26]|uniref:hypothetical protein n=1 Tax=Paracoccus sp. AK26 TaxID=2589076 RepID=UPI0014314824|nr:hypothetical protein [Paracoccus sp. AK26]
MATVASPRPDWSCAKDRTSSQFDIPCQILPPTTANIRCRLDPVSNPLPDGTVGECRQNRGMSFPEDISANVNVLLLISFARKFFYLGRKYFIGRQSLWFNFFTNPYRRPVPCRV